MLLAQTPSLPADDAAHAPAPTAQGMAGDAASPAAINRLSQVLAAGKDRSLKTRKKSLDLLKAALAAIRLNDFEGGAERALAVLKTDKTNGVAWHVLAICQEKVNRFGPALHAYEAALKLLPAQIDIAHDLGRLAQRLGYLEIAEKLLVKFLAANPGHIEATNNLACVMRDQQRYADAIETLRPMLQIEPESAILWNTLGTVLNDQGRLNEALTFFEEALRLNPGFAKARYNRANVRRPLGDIAGAMEDLEAALPGADGAYEVAMMNMARALMLMGEGRLPDGFEAYEVRFNPYLPDALRVAVPAPRWAPAEQDIRGRRLLIVGEQGIADELVFANCLNDVIEAVGPEGQVFIAVERRMVDLFQRSFPKAIVGGHKAVRLEGRLTRYVPFIEKLPADEAPEFWFPMASLMGVYRPSVAAFPKHHGYIRPDPERVSHWKAELEKLGPGLKVGLHWKSLVMSGSRAAVFASSFQRWEPILRTPGCVMINLQCGDVSDDLAAAEAAGAQLWTPPINLKDDLEDVAALSVACDLVIGPGIAGTNIAASCGARTWLVAAPDDWHLMKTDGYVFYPATRVFIRGAVDGWPAVIDDMRAALDRAVAEGWNAA
ncbi:MAG: tetratricopeptide repeat protein [Brevundimonas sp.]|uniref:tetratricopeptide repeat protein n=1 Tax=Brevundimonas sp. TaxID=1871086 RepID=UPI00391D7474